MSCKDILLKEYCNDSRLTDDDIVELFDSEGIVISKDEIRNIRNDKQTKPGVEHE